MKDEKIYSSFIVDKLKHFIENEDKKYPSVLELWPRKVDEETTLKKHLKSIGIVNHCSIDIPYRFGWVSQEIPADHNLLLHQQVEKLHRKVPNWEEDWASTPAKERPPPIETVALPSWDVVTNVNVSGWVGNQHWFWDNTHRMCKKNGIVFNIVPCVMPTNDDYAEGWGKKDVEGQKEYISYYYNKDFFDVLAAKNKYKILINTIIDDKDIGYFGDESVAFCVFKKINDDEFKGGGKLPRYRKA